MIWNRFYNLISGIPVYMNRRTGFWAGDNLIIIHYLLIIFSMTALCGFDLELLLGKSANSSVDIGHYSYTGGDI